MKEFKVIEVVKTKKSYENLEEALEKESADGWEVAGMNINEMSSMNTQIVVILQRDKQ